MALVSFNTINLVDDENVSLTTIQVNEDKAVVTCENGQLSLLDLHQLSLIESFHHKNEISSVCFDTRSGNHIIFASEKKIFCLDIRQMNRIVEEKCNFNKDDINVITQSECGKFLFSGDDSGEIKIFNLETNLLETTLKKHKNSCYTLKTRPQFRELISGGYDCAVIRWTSRNNRVKPTQQFDMNKIRPESSIPFINPSFVLDLDFNVNGTILAAGLQDNSIKLWDSSKAKMKFIWQIPEGNCSGVSQVLFLDECRLISGGNDGMLNMWDITEEDSDSKCFKFEHGFKINSLCRSDVEKSKLLVCDTTSKLTCYEIVS